jgi:hypothetical protein
MRRRLRIVTVLLPSITVSLRMTKEMLLNEIATARCPNALMGRLVARYCLFRLDRTQLGRIKEVVGWVHDSATACVLDDVQPEPVACGDAQADLDVAVFDEDLHTIRQAIDMSGLLTRPRDDAELLQALDGAVSSIDFRVP